MYTTKATERPRKHGATRTQMEDGKAIKDGTGPIKQIIQCKQLCLRHFSNLAPGA